MSSQVLGQSGGTEYLTSDPLMGRNTIMRLLTIPLLLVLIGSGLGAEDVSAFNIPDPVAACLKPVSGQYRISGRINPFYLRADFDGDGRADYAVLITNSKAARGIAVCRAGSRTAVIVGAGVVLKKMSDFDFGAWMVFPKGPVEKGVGEGAPPRLLGDAISIIWPESASALLYWDGQRFRWYQQGD